MRLLTDYELNLVAGGWGSSDWGYNEDVIWNGGSYTYHYNDDTIIVTGDNYGEDWYLSVGPDGGQTGGGGGDPPPYIPPPVANPTPCVEASPAGISLQDINNAALAASNAITHFKASTYEYSSIIWAANGVVGWTAPYTDRLTDQVNWVGGLHEVPQGAVIVGIVHNHPDIPGIPDAIPSGAGTYGGVDW